VGTKRSIWGRFWRSAATWKVTVTGSPAASLAVWASAPAYFSSFQRLAKSSGVLTIRLPASNDSASLVANQV
jgi:hypothetical protein